MSFLAICPDCKQQVEVVSCMQCLPSERLAYREHLYFSRQFRCAASGEHYNGRMPQKLIR